MPSPEHLERHDTPELSTADGLEDLQQQMDSRPDQRAASAVYRGPEAVAEQAQVSMGAQLSALRQVTDAAQQARAAEGSGWTALERKDLGTGTQQVAAILRALQADVPSLPGERPSRDASLLLNYRSVRSRVAGAPRIDHYHVRVGAIRQMQRDLRTLLPTCTPEEAAGVETVCALLDQYAAADRDMSYVSQLNEQRRNRGASKAFGRMGKLGVLVGGTLLSVAGGTIIALGGDANIITLAGPGMLLALMYPRLFSGNVRRAAEQGANVTQNRVYQSLIGPLGGKTLMEVMENIRSAGAREPVRTFFRDSAMLRAGRADALQDPIVNDLLDAMLPRKPDGGNDEARATLRDAILTDPQAMRTFITATQGLSKNTSLLMVRSFTERGGTIPSSSIPSQTPPADPPPPPE